MFVGDVDPEGSAGEAFSIGIRWVDALCDVFKTLGDLSDPLRVEWGFLLPSDGGSASEFFRAAPLSRCASLIHWVNDGWVGSASRAAWYRASGGAVPPAWAIDKIRTQLVGRQTTSSGHSRQVLL
ncbi:hypothetical protein NGF19_17735 [Streptomyces sp. RY43-2]|uniref:Uncharacterized protein n=1 Tax=Streptomyces macrolidinus TaxID=2952607 RepID=A0ABT0ZGA3_9ACTN|nr:hypothetical protein [Streptomyces macrolidinus]MCN9242614.1 hypothetical protein [Streptomyces macrolidinus]